MNPLIPNHKCVDFLPECRVPDGYGTAAVIGKNPAPSDTGSSTLRRVVAAAEKWRLSTFLFNMFSLRGSPADIAKSLRVDYDGTVGAFNNIELLEALDVDLVVAAWGQPSGIDLHLYRRREAEVMELVGRDRFVCVDLTDDGFPLHPMRWPTQGPLKVQDYLPKRADLVDECLQRLVWAMLGSVVDQPGKLSPSADPRCADQISPMPGSAAAHLPQPAL